MSAYHCSCGFAIDDADEFGDHFREVFDRGNDTGIDGRTHDEIDTGQDRPQAIACACGFQADGPAEFDDHMLLVLTPPDSIGNDGDKHIPEDPSTPVRWHMPGTPAE